MIKWFVYIVFLLVSTPCLLSAKTNSSRYGIAVVLHYHPALVNPATSEFPDTIKTVKMQLKPDLKVKEVPRKKSQPKPEKVDDAAAKKEKPKRQRRPDGMERPPEIPRRNDN
jgi:hypothetical protein